jgi:hypothetical protein
MDLCQQARHQFVRFIDGFGDHDARSLAHPYVRDDVEQTYESWSARLAGSSDGSRILADSVASARVLLRRWSARVRT